MKGLKRIAGILGMGVWIVLFISVLVVSVNQLILYINSNPDLTLNRFFIGLSFLLALIVFVLFLGYSLLKILDLLFFDGKILENDGFD